MNFIINTIDSECVGARITDIEKVKADVIKALTSNHIDTFSKCLDCVYVPISGKGLSSGIGYKREDPKAYIVRKRGDSMMACLKRKWAAEVISATASVIPLYKIEDYYEKEICRIEVKGITYLIMGISLSTAGPLAVMYNKGGDWYRVAD